MTTQNHTEHEIKEKPTLLTLITNGIVLFWVLCQLYFSGVQLPFSIDELKVFHLGFALAVLSFSLFSKAYAQKHIVCWGWLLVFMATVVTTVYFLTGYADMVERVGVPSAQDSFFGVALVALTLLLTWRNWGTIIPMVVIIALSYGLWGQHLGGLFRHSGIDPTRLIGYTSTYFMGTLGSLTSLSATMIFQFIVFGALLQCLGGFSLIEKLSSLVCKRFASGAAQTAIYSSAFIGMMTGSAAANVAVTGSFTIPMMKNRGYSADYAGGVEAVASTGGQILPPVMGVGAFIMASLVGIPYANICLAAIIPALIYFIHLSFSVAVHTAKLGMVVHEDKEDAVPFWASIKEIMLEHGHLLAPIVFLTWRIFAGDSPNKAAIMSNFLMIGIAFVHTVITQRHALKAALHTFGRNLYTGFVTGGKEGAKIAIVLAALGIVVDIFSTTGFGQRLSHAMLEIADGNVLILVPLAAILTLFFGMGMPTPGAYLLTVLLSAPVLIKFGFPVLSVHMFVFYFAVVAAITPPVAMASLVAVGISNGTYLGTAMYSMHLGIQGFLLPVFFLLRPETLALETEPVQALLSNFLLLLSGFGLTILMEGFFIRKVGWIGRLLCLGATLCILYPSDLLSVVGCALLVGFVGFHWKMPNKQQAVGA